MNKELQHWLGSNRPPRVQITYDVETLGSTVQAEIPFVVGIMGDFVGDTVLPPMVRRAFTDIDRDNFATVMQGLAPTLQLTGMAAYTVVRTPEGPGVQVDPVVTDEFAPALSFNSVADFAPTSIIRQVPALQALMQTRQNLSDLAAKLGTSPSQEATYLARATTNGAPAKTLAQATSALAATNATLTTSATGTLALFTAAVNAVLAAETPGLNYNAATNALAAVTAAVGDASSGYLQAYATATATTATSADIQIAVAQQWLVAAALRDGLAVLKQITDAYEPISSTDPKAAEKTTAQTDVARAITGSAPAAVTGGSPGASGASGGSGAGGAGGASGGSGAGGASGTGGGSGAGGASGGSGTGGGSGGSGAGGANGVPAFIVAAGQAALVGTSALALNPSSPTPAAPTPAPSSPTPAPPQA